MPDQPLLDDEDDGLDYELEPIDEHVLRQEELRVKEQIAKAEAAVDVDEVYRQLNQPDDIDFDWKKIKPQFSIKSLLIVTAVIATILAAWRIGFFNGSVFAALVALVLLTLGTIFAWTDLHQRRREEALQARHARKLARARGDDVPTDDEDLPEPKGIVEDLFDLVSRRPQFSTRDLLMTTAGVAVLLWFVVRLGPAPSALLMGLFALAGVTAEAFGANPPPMFRLVWWLSVLGYCLITLGHAVASSLGLA